MKKTKLFFTAASFLLFSISVIAQDNKQSVSIDPFAKGNWSFDLNRIASFKKTNYYKDDNKLAERSNSELNLQGMYFFSKGFGLGLNYASSWSQESQYSYHTQKVGASVQYGTSIGSRNYIYGRIGGALDWGAEVNHIPGSNNNFEYKNDGNNINAAIGIPIRLQQGGHTYLTPEISWDRNSSDYEDKQIIENSFGIGLKLQTYLSHNEFNCRKKIDAATINSRYNRGSQFIDFNSSGFFGLTKERTAYNVNTQEFKVDVSGGDLMVYYGYYIVDNFAVGAGVDFNTKKRGRGASTTKTSEWSFIPNLTFNLPTKNCWNNLFLNVEGGLGSTKYKSEGGINPFEYTEDFTTYGASLGFNYLISSHIALTPKIGYTLENVDYELGGKTKNRGPELSFGFRYIF